MEDSYYQLDKQTIFYFLFILKIYNEQIARKQYCFVC